MDWIEGHIKTLMYLTGMSESTARDLFLRVVRVEIDPTVAHNRTYQLAYTTTVNLLSRIFPKVQFERVEGASPKITPWGQFVPLVSEEQPEVIVRIGSGRTSETNTLSLWLDDWHVGIDADLTANADTSWNPVLAIIGSCYVAAAATAKLLQGAIHAANHWPVFSILDFENGTANYDFSQQISIGQKYLAGVGAVGSSFLFCLLAHGRCQGELYIFDEDVVDHDNLGRYPLFDASDDGTPKVLAAQERLSSIAGLSVIPIPCTLQKYCRQHESHPDFRIEGLISAPDKRETRRQFQHELPRRVWDASTGPDQVVIHTNEFTPILACMECIYPERPEEQAHLKHVAETLGLSFGRVKSGEPINESDAELIVKRYARLQGREIVGKDFDSVFRDLCSSNQLVAGDEVVLAPFSFTSMLAGAYQYLEFIKTFAEPLREAVPPMNYFTVNPMFPPNPYLRELRASRPSCSCQKKAFRDVFNKLWEKD